MKSLMILCILLPAVAFAKEPWNSNGDFKVYYVADKGLSALRPAPTPESVCKRRLGVGRKVYVGRCFNTAYGRYCRVAVTRRTRGYLLAEALISTQKGAEHRLLQMALKATGKERLTLLWLSKQLFPRSGTAQEVEKLFVEEATKAASLLDRKIKRAGLQSSVETERYLLNHHLLDGYSRMGIFFRLDSEGRLRYVRLRKDGYKQQRDEYGSADSHSDEAAPEADLD